MLFLLKGSSPLPAHTSLGGWAEEVAAFAISVHWQLWVQPETKGHTEPPTSDTAQESRTTGKMLRSSMPFLSRSLGINIVVPVYLGAD